MRLDYWHAGDYCITLRYGNYCVYLCNVSLYSEPPAIVGFGRV